MPRQKRGISSAFYDFFGPTESKDIKQLKKIVAILTQNERLQQFLIESNIYATNITRIHLAKSRHVIDGFVLS